MHTDNKIPPSTKKGLQALTEDLIAKGFANIAFALEELAQEHEEKIKIPSCLDTSSSV